MFYATTIDGTDVRTIWRWQFGIVSKAVRRMSGWTDAQLLYIGAYFWYAD